MALLQSWSTTVKLALPLLVVMAIAIAPSICGAQLEHDVVELSEAAPLAKAGRGRFLSGFDGTPMGRRLLNNLNLCASQGISDNCKRILPFAKNAQCCTYDNFNNRQCFDVGAFLPDHCGACNTKCSWPRICCSGVCTDVRSSDRNNCGGCGIRCKNNFPCQNGICGYNGKF